MRALFISAVHMANRIDSFVSDPFLVVLLLIILTVTSIPVSFCMVSLMKSLICDLSSGTSCNSGSLLIGELVFLSLILSSRMASLALFVINSTISVVFMMFGSFLCNLCNNNCSYVDVHSCSCSIHNHCCIGMCCIHIHYNSYVSSPVHPLYL